MGKDATSSRVHSLMYGWPITWRRMAISCRVASSICCEDASPTSAPRSMILAANSLPVSFSMHRRTVELMPLSWLRDNEYAYVYVCVYVCCLCVRAHANSLHLRPFHWW